MKGSFAVPTQSAAAAPDAISIRPLARLDLDAVVAIDAAIEGWSRRAYFERRLRAALHEPALHAQFAASDARGLAGYILARVLEGEFGESAARVAARGGRRPCRSGRPWRRLPSHRRACRVGAAPRLHEHQDRRGME